MSDDLIQADIEPSESSEKVTQAAAEFTPGIWKVCKGLSEADDLRCGVTVLRGKREYLVATIENGAPGDFCETEHANACLIAAAPQLFEALKWFIDDIDGTHTVMLEFDANVERARAALAKARGAQVTFSDDAAIAIREED